MAPFKRTHEPGKPSGGMCSAVVYGDAWASEVLCEWGRGCPVCSSSCCWTGGRVATAAQRHLEVATMALPNTVFGFTLEP